MPDFKGRKDFPEVADAKIKIGDYSGSNRLSVTDIYSPKAEPELRDQMMEPVKGKTNNYDSPILSQQPVITLSDMDAEAALIDAISGYVAKQDSYSDVEEGFGDPKQKPPREPHPSLAHDEGASPRQRRKPRRNPQAKDYQKSDFSKKVPVPQGALKDTPASGAAGGAAGGAGGGGFQGNPGAWRDTGSSGASQSTPPKPPTSASSSPPPLRQPTRPPSYRAAQPRASQPYTDQQKRNAEASGTYSVFNQPGGGAGGPKTTPGAGLDQGPKGPGVRQRAQDAGRRGFHTTRRGLGGLLSDVGSAAKVGLQQGIRQGKEGAYEQGPEADARRAEQRAKVQKNPLTRAVASVARGSRAIPGMRRGAKAMGFGRTKAEEDAMKTRMEYANDDEMMLSDILNELESYVANEQQDNSVVERQLTKGNISKMMRNTEDKAPRDWKYHV
ncbi:hypothetical protein CMI37_38415 [Candidatus Pacearchaeota archaeon]|nr:hypothetical protein [Candidatus Pacearchaeota archaeon]